MNIIVTLFFLTAVKSGCLFDLKRCCEEILSGRTQVMVYEGMSKSTGMARTYRPSTLHHILLSRYGYSPMDCQFRNIPTEVPRGLWRYSCNSKLDLQSHCGTIISISDTRDWNILDILYIWSYLCCGFVLCTNLRAGN